MRYIEIGKFAIEWWPGIPWSLPSIERWSYSIHLDIGPLSFGWHFYRGVH